MGGVLRFIVSRLSLRDEVAGVSLHFGLSNAIWVSCLVILLVTCVAFKIECDYAVAGVDQKSVVPALYFFCYQVGLVEVNVCRKPVMKFWILEIFHYGGNGNACVLQKGKRRAGIRAHIGKLAKHAVQACLRYLCTKTLFITPSPLRVCAFCISFYFCLLCAYA